MPASNYNEYMRNYMLKRYYKRRLYYLEKLGNECVLCCSEDELQFDHTDHTTKSFEFAKALSGWSKKRLDEEMSKAQLLCRPCHEYKTIFDKGNKPWEHGTLSGYRWCKCSLCKTAHSSYNKEYMRKRRAGE